MSINELFGTTTTKVNFGARSLPGTAELTSVASEAVDRILRAMEADIETYRPRIQESSVSTKALEDLLDEFRPLYDIEEDSILRSLDDETVDSMLKSQQSKRSRTKSKTMTLDNYRSLLNAAISEDILRELYNKPKSSVGISRSGSTVDYTGAELEKLAADQDALRREIRNLQSKKSIMKSKADFDETSERWLSLLKAEQQLKDLRVNAAPQVVEVDTTKEALSEMLADTDISKLSSKDAHALLETISQLAKQ